MSWTHYYIPRSSLNPHGTYAIVDADDMQADASGRHHLAEVSGFGDGSPNRRSTPGQVHLITAAPDMLAALQSINKVASPNPERTFDDVIRDLNYITDCARRAIALATHPQED